MNFLLAAAPNSGTEELTGITGWAADVMTNLGGPGVGGIVALENLFPPIPSEVVLPLSGFLAGQGELNLVAVICWATLGSVVGALILYGLGAVLGADRLRHLADRLPLVSVSDVHRAEQWFARHGGKAVFLGRLIPLVRSFISIPAGTERMPLPRFLAYTAAGSGLWNTLFVVLGYGLGRNWQQVGQYSSYLNTTVIAMMAGVVLIFVARRVKSLRGTTQS